VSGITIRWMRREPPLPIAGMIAQDVVAGRVAESILSRSEAATDSLRVSLNQRWILVLGPENALPWVDGVTYLGWEASLLLPTLWSTTPPSFLMARGLQARLRTYEKPIVAVVPECVLISEAATRAPNRPDLLNFASMLNAKT
jgi:MoxR-vWA-beta-propeller ternary system domain bpX5